MVSKKSSATLIGAATLSALLLLAGCGGGSSSDDPAPTPEPPAPAPTPEPPKPTPPQPTPTPPPEPTPPAPEGVTLASTYTDLADVSLAGEMNWADGSGTGSPIAGVNCIVPPVAYHRHSLLSIYKDGVRLVVPKNIGIVGNCTYELHTHQRSGVVHVEPMVAKPLTLGQFFAVWGQPLSRNGVAGLSGPARFYVIDNEVLTRFDGNPAEIVFAPHKEIVIVTGTAPVVLTKYRWPATL